MNWIRLLRQSPNLGLISNHRVTKRDSPEPSRTTWTCKFLSSYNHMIAIEAHIVKRLSLAHLMWSHRSLVDSPTVDAIDQISEVLGLASRGHPRTVAKMRPWSLLWLICWRVNKTKLTKCCVNSRSFSCRWHSISRFWQVRRFSKHWDATLWPYRGILARL